jgi:circadian clock protein KaiB
MTRRPKFKFRLYIADGSENSILAVENLQALCREHLADAHEIEVVDVRREPKRAIADHVFMTPTLIKLAPFPARRVVGTLDLTDPLLRVLGLYEASRPSRPLP